MSAQQRILPYTSVFVKLLKGPVEYVEKSTWEKLIQHKVELTGFLLQLGLALVLDEQDGYAYIKHYPFEEDENPVSWIQRRALTYEESVNTATNNAMPIGSNRNRQMRRSRCQIANSPQPLPTKARPMRPLVMNAKPQAA